MPLENEAKKYRVEFSQKELDEFLWWLSRSRKGMAFVDAEYVDRSEYIPYAPHDEYRVRLFVRNSEGTVKIGEPAYYFRFMSDGSSACGEAKEGCLLPGAPGYVKLR